MDAKIDAYAMEWTGGIMVDYLRSNDGRWPGGWEDLRDTFESEATRASPLFTFEELQERVWVDWDFDPDAYFGRHGGKAGSDSFEVVRLRSGRRTFWPGFEPNEMIYEQLARMFMSPTSQE